MKNFELKARGRDLGRDRKICRAIGARLVVRLKQRDTYFAAHAGRLKLREQAPGEAQLIAYLRPDRKAARLCDYTVIPVSHPAHVRKLFSTCLGRLGEIRKVRELYVLGGVRIHLDRVRDLGTFLEFEAVLEPGKKAISARHEIRRLSKAFGIRPSDTVSGSYLDLLLARHR